ncbi:MAG: glycine cleavage system protein H, partial [Coriobacteriia bacterium]|nr:glycine cleavage system protein H [Coriobacteriia bacterium]
MPQAEQLGDLVYLQLPELETTLAAGEPIFVVESVKTASEVALPFSCE